MILAHLADLHLGYRAYHRLAPGGINARERDVARAFRQALDRIIDLRPDVVLVAGDVFHTVRPSNSAIADAFHQFARLRASLSAAPVVIIAGNHDSPRAVETGSILRLLAEIPGIHVVDDDARAVHLPELDTTVLCLPHAALAGETRVAMEPDPAAATNILMLHGTVTGGAADARLRFLSEFGGARVESSEIRPQLWDYVALGHYHIATELAPGMWYSGAVERTSTNIWEETGAAKGFLTFDTDTGRATFHPVETRAVVDLPRFSARTRRGSSTEDTEATENYSENGHGEIRDDRGSSGSPAASVPSVPSVAQRDAVARSGRYLSASDIDERIRSLVESIDGGIEGKIVRLVIEDVPRELFRELDHRKIREYKADALHFHLDARRPEVRRIVGYGAPYRRRTLDEEVQTFLERQWQPSSDQIRRERLVELAQRYLIEARRREVEDALLETGPDPS